MSSSQTHSSLLSLPAHPGTLLFGSVDHLLFPPVSHCPKPPPYRFYSYWQIQFLYYFEQGDVRLFINRSCYVFQILLPQYALASSFADTQIYTSCSALLFCQPVYARHRYPVCQHNPLGIVRFSKFCTSLCSILLTSLLFYHFSCFIAISENCSNLDTSKEL